jgi:extradiol dioxygenase family protein
MKLAYIYQPVTDLDAAARFHRDLLGLEESWREGDTTIAFDLPDGSAQIMLDTEALPAGPMYQVDDADAWMSQHPDIPVTVDRFEIPGGVVFGLHAPGENVFYIFDLAAE